MLYIAGAVVHLCFIPLVFDFTSNQRNYLSDALPVGFFCKPNIFLLSSSFSFHFALMQNETKNQEITILSPHWGLPTPGVFSGQRTFFTLLKL